MFCRRLLFAGYVAFLVHVHVLLVLFSVNCHANNNTQKQQQIHKNSCGDVPNFSFPFRLKADPSDNCGYKYFGLECENNRTVLHLYSGKYYVKGFNYHTIRLVDVGVERNNCSALPLHSLTNANFTESDPYYLNSVEIVALVSCEKPVKSPSYIDTSSTSSSSTAAACENGGVSSSSSSSSSSKKHSYVLVVGREYDPWSRWSDVANLCSVDMMFPASPRRERNISSLLDVHNQLADGFDLDWYFYRKRYCTHQAAQCFYDALNVTGACEIYYEESHLTGISAFLDALSTFLRFLFSRRFYKFLFSGRFRNYYWWKTHLIQKIIGGILFPRILFALCGFAFLIHKFRRRHLSMFDSIEGYLRSQNHLMPISYSYSDIKKMTKGFKDKLGEGGYGSVYKGKLRSGHFVAIKVLGKAKANGQEFINEVATIGRIHHVNVVQLIGYCAERSKRALVYDFMPNGSLEKYIFSQEGDISLSCMQMYEISLGVARGIEYLHRGCDMQILHFDIKPHNILLDENFTPKVSDFGLAKLYPTDDSIVTLTAARGTLGYMAPELFYKNIGGVSYKADVYSFGMLLMEIAGRRRNWNALADSSQIYFPCWVYDQFNEGREIEMGETNDEENVMVKKMMLVALWCIQMKPSDRPSMNKVVEMLEGNTESVLMPPRPFLYPQEMPTQNHGIDANPTNLPTLSGACLDDITLDISAR